MMNSFIFHRLEYAQTLSHMGVAEQRNGVSVPLIVRSIDESGACDGLLPWPYVRIEEEDVAAIRTQFGHVVSVVGVVAPKEDGCKELIPMDSVPFRDQYIYDYRKPISHSRRTLKRIEAATRRWKYSWHTDHEYVSEISRLYKSMARLRILKEGGMLDFPLQHFVGISRVSGYRAIVLHGSGDRIGAFACGIVSDDDYHLLHMASEPDALRGDGVYGIMAHVLEWCRVEKKRLWLGSVPRTGSVGLEIMKARWSNLRQETRLIRLILRENDYRSLMHKNPNAGQGGFFPAYRHPW